MIRIRRQALWGVAVAAITALVLWRVVFWLVLHASWGGTVAECTQGGACWVYVRDNGYQLFYGLYPQTELWRINTLLLAYAMAVLLLVKVESVRFRLGFVLFLMLTAPTVVYGMLGGGVMGLVGVSPQNWGGLSVNILFSLTSVVLAFPLGFLLAIMRRKKWGLYRFLAKVFIDILRSLPLVSVLFFALLVLPLLFTADRDPGKMVRLFMMFTMFVAAYMAEAIRGGLQSVDRGQIEAARALGLRPLQIDWYVIYPQALEVAMPSVMNIVITAIKDTTLLSTVTILEVVAIMQASTATVRWMPYALEAYLFIGFIFWTICYGASKMGQHLERSMRVGRVL